MTSTASVAGGESANENGQAAFEGKAQKLARLRKLAAKQPQAASVEAWEWVTGFKALATHHDLGWLFAQGVAPESPEGDCEGEVLGLYGASWLDGVDRLVRIGRLLGGIGWTGKTFNPRTGRGYNRLTPSSRIPMLLAMPRYRFERRNGELIGFHFDHQLQPSPLSPELTVRAISYANPSDNNPLVLPDTLDELVEIVPQVYLGRVLHRDRRGWRAVGYFALRQPVGN